MSSAAVERLVSELDISGCGSLDLEARAHLVAKSSTYLLSLMPSFNLSLTGFASLCSGSCCARVRWFL